MGKSEAAEILEENETLSSLVDLAGNIDIAIGDLSRYSNWGIYKGDLVLIDLGASTAVIKTHYS